MCSLLRPHHFTSNLFYPFPLFSFFLTCVCSLHVLFTFASFLFYWCIYLAFGTLLRFFMVEICYTRILYSLLLSRIEDLQRIWLLWELDDILRPISWSWRQPTTYIHRQYFFKIHVFVLILFLFAIRSLDQLARFYYKNIISKEAIKGLLVFYILIWSITQVTSTIRVTRWPSEIREERERNREAVAAA